MEPPIVVSGGSIIITVPEEVFPPEAGQKGKFKNDNKKIKRIEITGSGIENYAEDAKNSNITVTIYYETK